MSNKDLNCNPTPCKDYDEKKDTEHAWWYEDQYGLLIVVSDELPTIAPSLHTRAARIPWASIRKAVHRKDVRRPKP